MNNDRSSDRSPGRGEPTRGQDAAGDAPMDTDRDPSGAWQAPWVASPEHPAGAADAPVPPQQATGHYGPGYDDPTRHFGNTLPGRPDTDPLGEGGAGSGTHAGMATPPSSGERSATDGAAPSTDQTAAARSESAIHEREAPEGAHHPTEDPERAPDFTPEEVGFRPPDRAPSEEAPTSENAGLIFERS